MLNHNNHTNAVASGLLELNDIPPSLDKKARERQAARRKMAARRAIERHFERREIEMHTKEYWFDG